MKSFFRRLGVVTGILLFIATIMWIIPSIFIVPIYWLITGRNYITDVCNLANLNRNFSKDIYED